MIGIYKIINTTTGDCYIGQSRDINARWRKHRSNYNKSGNHYDYYLYRAFRKYGIENFEFEVIEECRENDLLERERHYYELIKPKYNLISPITNPMDNDKVQVKHKVACRQSWGNKKDDIKKKSLDNLVKGEGYKFNKKRVKAINIETLEEFIFNSMYEAENKLKINRSSISQILNRNHNRKQSKGFTFEYVN